MTKIAPFTEIQIQKIKDEYLLKPINQLSKELGTSSTRLRRFLRVNNLVIPKEIIQQRMVDSRKKKGDIPFNKGKKQKDYMRLESIKKTSATRFKKGNIPHNTNPEGNGAVVDRKDSSGITYQYIRISLSEWKLYTHHVWEKKNGKIPNSHVVVFKRAIEKTKENTVPENLILASKAELMYRNSKHNYPDEVIPTLLIFNNLNKKIIELQK